MLWRGLQLPSRLDFERETASDTFGRFSAQPFERGFGTTIGNALRRVLLSSIEGAAVTAVKIDGVQEDVVHIMLNLKGVVLKLHNRDEVTRVLRKEGEGAVTAADIQTPHDEEAWPRAFVRPTARASA